LHRRSLSDSDYVLIDRVEYIVDGARIGWPDCRQRRQQERLSFFSCEINTDAQRLRQETRDGPGDVVRVPLATDIDQPACERVDRWQLLERVRARMSWILPLTLAIVFVILYLNFRGAAQSLIVMTSVPFAAVGAIWMLWAFGFNTSIAVWVGMIALLGVAAETASVMVVYLDEAWEAGRAAGTITTKRDLVEHALEAATKRVRPLLMTVLANVFGLLPILFDDGVGADLAKRIALPMWGGLVSLTILTLFVIPAVYVVWRSFHLRHSAKPKLGSLADGER